MELKLEAEKFESYQDAFVEEITKTIMVKLVESGLEGAQMRDLFRLPGKGQLLGELILRTQQA